MLEKKHKGRHLKEWYAKNRRELPWRGSKDPYRVWLSEVILQQTRIDQGLDYYHSFIREFPDVEKLAQASEQKVLKLWEGLGYYSRARNLHKASKVVLEQYNAVFPTSSEELSKLPGIGPYTAAAIASICFDEKVLAVDGNIIRVVSRLFGIWGQRGQRSFTDKIESEALNLYFDPPGDLNQALMDFGSMVCTPKNPDCPRCPFREDCYSLEHNLIDQLPEKREKKASRKRYLYYLVRETEDVFTIQQRGDGDIWAKLFEFPHVERDEPKSTREVLEEIGFQGEEMLEETGFIKHTLSHQEIFANFVILKPSSFHFDKIGFSETRGDYSRKDMIDLPFPRLITNFLEERYSLYGRSK